MTHEQTLIWALRKELTAKGTLIMELENKLEKQKESLLLYKVNADPDSQQHKDSLQQIYEKKLEEAVEREKIEMREAFQVQLELKIKEIGDQADQVISKRQQEMEQIEE